MLVSVTDNKCSGGESADIEAPSHTVNSLFDSPDVDLSLDSEILSDWSEDEEEKGTKRQMVQMLSELCIINNQMLLSNRVWSNFSFYFAQPMGLNLISKLVLPHMCVHSADKSQERLCACSLDIWS